MKAKSTREIQIRAATVPASHDILCLACATIFASGRGKIGRCPKCGWSVNVSDYHELFAEAGRVLRFGVLYRIVFEKDLEEDGEVRSMACLHEAPQWLIFCALAVLSGIIGNASYAAVKRVIHRVLPKDDSARHYTTIVSFDDVQIHRLMTFARDYLDGLRSVSPELRELVAEEERAHIVGAERAHAAEVADDTDDEAVESAVRNAVRAAIQKIKAGDTACIDRAKFQRLLSEVWNELPME